MQSLHKSRYSFGYKFAISAALLGALVACDQGSKSKNRADKAPDSVTNDIKVNPLKTGTSPKEKTTFYTQHLLYRSDAELNPSKLTLDPETKTFVYEYIDSSNEAAQFTGQYDPETGILSKNESDDCVNLGCPLLDRDGTYTFSSENLIGEGRVVLDPETQRYWGVSPTGRDNMPSNKATYIGTFVGEYVYGNMWRDFYHFEDLKGTAKTQVNFDTNVLNARFDDFEAGRVPDGMSTRRLNFRLEGATIDGDQFSGGRIRLVNPKQGYETSFETADAVSGQFFGSNAQELGGEIYTFDGYSSLSGAWNGTKQ